MRKIYFEGNEYQLVEDAYMGNCGEAVLWFAKATDSEGNEYRVTWKHIEEGYNEDIPSDFENCADWDNPIEVEII